MVVKIAILCVPAFDESAIAVLRRLLIQHIPGAVILQETSAVSQRYLLEEILRKWCDEEEYDLVITIGGTLPAPGPSAGEIVPEATLAVVERLLPGLSEAMRAHAQAESSLALLDRGVAGIRGRSAILNLPESAAAAVLFFQAVCDVMAPLLAHLQGAHDAPRLQDVLELSEGPENETSASAAGSVDRAHKALSSTEFAAFLARKGKGNDNQALAPG